MRLGGAEDPALAVPGGPELVNVERLPAEGATERDHEPWRNGNGHAAAGARRSSTTMPRKNVRLWKRRGRLAGEEGCDGCCDCGCGGGMNREGEGGGGEGVRWSQVRGRCSRVRRKRWRMWERAK